MLQSENLLTADLDIVMTSDWPSVKCFLPVLSEALQINLILSFQSAAPVCHELEAKSELSTKIAEKGKLSVS